MKIRRVVRVPEVLAWIMEEHLPERNFISGGSQLERRGCNLISED